MTSFLPHTSEERAAMLQTIGMATEQELFAHLPESIKQFAGTTHLPPDGRTEMDLQQYLTRMSQQNAGAMFDSFQGGGAYARFIPPAVNSLALRSEFYTAYTPYQPEVSQGTLQVIYEFQTMISELSGMDVTNASVYDGAHAVAEAASMTLRATRRKVVYYADSLNPYYQEVLRTYLGAFDDIELKSFSTDQPLAGQLTHEAKAIAGVIVQYPDYYGHIIDLTPYGDFCKESGALLVASVDPFALALLEPPKSFGAHIVCGDIQQFGNSVNYGGPYGGFVSTLDKYMRQLPGRLVGKTTDKNGNGAYTLTLQTREQHIRREKATSNICTNQSLNMLKASIYLSLVGPEGLKQLSLVSAQRAHYLAEALLALPEVSMVTKGAFLNEFAVRLPIPASVMVKQLAQSHQILAGIDVGRYYPDHDHTLLVAVTELNSLESIERYIDAFKAVLNHHGLSVVPTSGSQRTPMMATGTFGRVD